MELVKGLLKNIPLRPTPNKGGALHPELIVLHDTAGRLDDTSAISWLCNPSAKASAHFVIDRKGKLTQLLSCNIVAWHAGASIYKGRSGCNQFSVGIEIVNPGKMTASTNPKKCKAWFGQEFDIAKDKCEWVQTPHHGAGYWMEYTEEQIKTAQELCAALAECYPISDITAHYIISPGRKVDVNPLFPLEYFKSRAQGRKEDVMMIDVKDDAAFRKWPSFYTENIESGVSKNGGKFRVVKSGTYLPAGDIKGLEEKDEGGNLSLPLQLWYQVETLKGPLWVWDKEVKHG